MLDSETSSSDSDRGMELLKQLQKKNPHKKAAAQKKVGDALAHLETKNMSEIDKKLLKGLMQKRIDDDEGTEEEKHSEGTLGDVMRVGSF